MPPAAPKRIWIDTDCALGAQTFLPRDVDDGYALAATLAAVRREPARYELLGISATSGNTHPEVAHRCVENLLSAFDYANVRIVGHQSQAARAIAAIDGDFALLALGPLTNIANAIALRPNVAERAHLSVVGTVLNPRRWRRRLSDLNIKRAPSAALCIRRFSSRRIFPLDVVERLVMNRERLLQTESCGPPGAYLARHSTRWLRWSLLKHGRKQFPLWDLVAALYAIDRLENPTWDLEMRLTSFDAETSWEAFLKLL